MPRRIDYYLWWAEQDTKADLLIEALKAFAKKLSEDFNVPEVGVRLWIGAMEYYDPHQDKKVRASGSYDTKGKTITMRYNVQPELGVDWAVTAFLHEFKHHIQATEKGVKFFDKEYAEEELKLPHDERPSQKEAMGFSDEYRPKYLPWYRENVEKRWNEFYDAWLKWKEVSEDP